MGLFEFFLAEKNPSDEFRRACAGVILRYLEVRRRSFEDGDPAAEADAPATKIEVTQEGALELLARRLHWKMEFLDPTNDPPEWGLLSEHQREFYRACTTALFQERRLARIALG